MRFILSTVLLMGLSPLSAVALSDSTEAQIVRNCTDPGDSFSDACRDALMKQCYAINACSDLPDPNSRLACADSAGSSYPKECSSKKGTGSDFSDGDGHRQNVTTEHNNNSNTDNSRPKPNGDSSADLDSCYSQLRKAESACDTSQANSFSNQVSKSNTGAIGTTNGAQQISNVVGACDNAIDSCGTCDDLASSWDKKCRGSGACTSLDQSNISKMSSYGGQCSDLVANRNTLRNAGNKAVQDANNGMNPSSNNPNNNGDQSQMIAASTQPDCNNPVNHCGQQASDTSAVPSDSAGKASKMASAQPGQGIPNASGMDTGLSPASSQSPQFANNMSPASNAAAGMGMFGGGGSSSSGFGQPGNNQNANAAVGPQKHGMGVASYDPAKTLQGERAGGATLGGPGRGLASEPARRRRGGGFDQFRGLASDGSGDDMGRMRGLDLKRYLPGGDRYHRLSGASMNAMGIHGPNENLWTSVTNRFQIHCRLNLLYGCR